MPALVNILLPTGIRTVPVARVPRLIADALYPRPANTVPLTVRIFGKAPRRPRPGRATDYQPLTERDERRLRRLWGAQVPLDGIRLADWDAHLYAFDAAPDRPAWSLAWRVEGGAANAEQRVRCMEEHRRDLSKTICQGKLMVRDAATLRPEVGLWGNALQAAVLTVTDLAQYISQFDIGVHRLELPTERPEGERDYNLSEPVDWTQIDGRADLPARDAVLLMHGLNPQIHQSVSVPTPLAANCKAAEFFEVVRDVLGAAKAQPLTTRPASEWLRWADDLEIVVQSGFRRFVEAQRAWRGTVEVQRAWRDKGVTPLPLTGAGAPTSSTRLTVFHTIRNKTGALDAVIQLARIQAADPTDPQSVFAALVRIAEAPNRPAPLLGYAEGEGVLYRDKNDPCKHLSPGEFGKRFRRLLEKSSES